MNDLYQITVPVFVKTLTSLDGIIAKAQAHVADKGLDEATLINAQLAPDMFPFKKQVQVACDNAKGAAARLSESEIPVFADEENTLAELRTRIQKTLSFLSSLPQAKFEGAATRQITLSYFPGKYLTGLDYTREHVLPNFFFHAVTAYDILRKEGVVIGKADYIGGLTLKDL